MPTYDYECNACGHAFEQFQSIKAGPIRKCPSCGKRTVRRLIGTGGGVIFKGSGFYQTDYRSESYKKSVEGEKPAAPAASPDKPAKPAAPAAKSDKSSDSK